MGRGLRTVNGFLGPEGKEGVNRSGTGGVQELSWGPWTREVRVSAVTVVYLYGGGGQPLINYKE